MLEALRLLAESNRAHFATQIEQVSERLCLDSARAAS